MTGLGIHQIPRQFAQISCAMNAKKKTENVALVVLLSMLLEWRKRKLNHATKKSP
jgi:hypothetical protein